MRKFLIVLTLFIAIGAVGGAVMMWLDPNGNGWGGAPMLDLLRAKMPWPDIFFKNFIPSGFALLAVNGLTQFLAALMLIKKLQLAYWVTLACGIILMLWIVLEWWDCGFSVKRKVPGLLDLLIRQDGHQICIKPDKLLSHFLFCQHT